MATVTVYTAARMQQIEDKAITDARLDGTDLVLIANDLTEINVGDIQGIQGPIGPVGPSNPVGTILEFAGSVLPAGYLWCDGAEYDPAVEVDLFNAIGIAFGGDGVTTFNVPDKRDRVGVGVSLTKGRGSVGGSEDAVVVSHDHNGPSHTHPFDSNTGNDTHSHTISGNTANDTHSHSISGTAASNGAHTHGSGSYAAASGGSHTHARGSLTTSGGGSHSHGMPYPWVAQTGGGDLGLIQDAWAPGVIWGNPLNTAAFNTNSVGNHSHSISGSTASGGSHTHDVTGSSGSAGAHTHSLSGSTNNDTHNHSMSFTSASDTHSHTLSGTTDASGTGKTSTDGESGVGKNMQPYVALNYIIKN
jgi:microcystin-dependent protein